MKTITEDGEILDEVTHEIIAREPPQWKTPYNHDTDHEAEATALTCHDPSMTQQQFAKDADINNILAKFLNTGELPVTGNPIYQDIAKEFDLQNEIVTSYQVEQAWLQLPVAARNTLQDPKKFADYVHHCLTTGDLDPLRELGLAKKRDLYEGEEYDPRMHIKPPPAAPQAAAPPGGAPTPPPPNGPPSGPTT